jgi:hypothetical protein
MTTVLTSDGVLSVIRVFLYPLHNLQDYSRFGPGALELLNPENYRIPNIT